MNPNESPNALDPEAVNAPHVAAANLDSPALSPRTRTTLYVGAAAVQFVALVGFGLAGVFGAISAEQATQGIAIVTGALGTLTAAVASVYRPTRPDAPA